MQFEGLEATDCVVTIPFSNAFDSMASQTAFHHAFYFSQHFPAKYEAACSKFCVMDMQWYACRGQDLWVGLDGH
jgi:hypothetical protein